eukprot:7374893-Lingulodinium_polyedra.AAC.1
MPRPLPAIAPETHCPSKNPRHRRAAALKPAPRGRKPTANRGGLAPGRALGRHDGGAPGHAERAT